VFSLLMLIAGGWVILENWWTGLVCFVKRESSTWIPILGGGLGAIGCFLSPYAVLNKLWWVPLLIDWGCVPGFSYSAIYFAISFVRGRKGRT
jgi:hypothetical protein